MSASGGLGDALKFDIFNGKNVAKQAFNNPLQMLLGAGDPLSAKMWSGITGKNFTPLVNQFGGPTGDAYRQAEAAGMNTGSAKTLHGIAQTIAGLYAGGAGLQALGGLGSGAGAGAGAGSSAGITAAPGMTLAGQGTALGNLSGMTGMSGITAAPGMTMAGRGTLTGDLSGMTGQWGAVQQPTDSSIDPMQLLQAFGSLNQATQPNRQAPAGAGAPPMGGMGGGGGGSINFVPQSGVTLPYQLATSPVQGLLQQMAQQGAGMRV